MTAKELMYKLAQFPPSMEVVFETNDEEYDAYFVESVSKKSIALHEDFLDPSEFETGKTIEVVFLGIN